MTQKEFWLKLFAENDTALAAVLVLVDRFITQEQLERGKAYIESKKKELYEEMPRCDVEAVPVALILRLSKNKLRNSQKKWWRNMEYDYRIERWRWWSWHGLGMIQNTRCVHSIERMVSIESVVRGSKRITP